MVAPAIGRTYALMGRGTTRMGSRDTTQRILRKYANFSALKSSAVSP